MITAQYPLEWSARLVVGSVRTLTRRRIAVSCIGLVLTLLAAGGYIDLPSVAVNAPGSPISVPVVLPQSGGLFPDQDVTLRGTPIGRVQSVNFTDTGVVAVAALDAGVSVPDNSMVRVSPLSPDGENDSGLPPPHTHG